MAKRRNVYDVERLWNVTTKVLLKKFEHLTLEAEENMNEAEEIDRELKRRGAPLRWEGGEVTDTCPQCGTVHIVSDDKYYERVLLRCRKCGAEYTPEQGGVPRSAEGGK